VHEPGQVAAVALVGQQADIEAEPPALERAADPVQAARQPPQHRHERDQLVGGALAQRRGAQLFDEKVDREAAGLRKDVEAGCELRQRALERRQRAERTRDFRG
jgi:hypothetical protein